MMRRSYRVYIGKYGNAEGDFVAEKQGTLVTADMSVQETFEREMRPLHSIKDNYTKTVLTPDRLTLGNYGGIVVKNVQLFLKVV